MADPNPWPRPDFGRNANTADVLIIGSGISGMTTAIDMIRNGNGRNFIIVEKGDSVGGTWSDNVYPGCCCDVWSHLYSLSFEPNTKWTREYPGQEEILEYLTNVAQKYKLYNNLRFNTAVIGSKYEDDTGTWVTRVRRSGGKSAEFASEYTIRTRFLVSAVGQLNQPKLANIKGLANVFQGKVMHSSRWDWSFPLDGLKVGVIGSGASSIQLIPEVAKIASSVTVFQRSPNWIVPRGDEEISAIRQAAYKYLPFARRRHRANLMDIREEQYAALFDVNGPIHKWVKDATTDQIKQTFPGPSNHALWQALTPDYPPGCKRILISDDYFPSLAKENVTLETASIIEATATGIRVGRGYNSKLNNHEELDYELDAIVSATGFKATQFLWPLDIRNGENKSLEETWSKGAEAYLGMTVSGFPNFAILFGPSTNLGHNSIILMIEAQSRYINALIGQVLKSKDQPKSGLLSIEPRKDVSDRWNAKVQEKLSKSTLASDQCNSWYKSANGHISTNWSETVIEYQKQTSFVQWSDYVLKGPGAAALLDKGKTSWSRVVEETSISNVTALLCSVACAATLAGGLGYYWRAMARA